MFENTICCVFSKGGMPPVAPLLSASTFKLTLRRFLRSFTCRSHRPQTPPPMAHTTHPQDPPVRKKMGPRSTRKRTSRVRVDRGRPSIFYGVVIKSAGQRCANDVPTGEPPGRPRSVACDRHVCRPAWSIYRHAPRFPAARAGRHRPQACG